MASPPPLTALERLQISLGTVVTVVWGFLHLYILVRQDLMFPGNVDYIMGIVAGGLFAPAFLGRWRRDRASR